MMLIFGTLPHFHITIEKVLGSCVAVAVWFVLYRGVYTQLWSPVGTPGTQGPFKYVTFKTNEHGEEAKTNQFDRMNF